MLYFSRSLRRHEIAISLFPCPLVSLSRPARRPLQNTLAHSFRGIDIARQLPTRLDPPCRAGIGPLSNDRGGLRGIVAGSFALHHNVERTRLSAIGLNILFDRVNIVGRGFAPLAL